MKAKVTEILKQEANAILNIPVTDSFELAVELIHRHVHRQGGKLVTSGMGKAGEIAQSISTTFSSTGTPAVFLHPSEAQHGDLGVIQFNDVLLLISNSGKTREILELVDLALNLYEQLQIVVITSQPESQLGRSADVCIHTGNPKEVCPLGLSPTTSTTIMAVIGDALIVLMMNRIGFTNKEYAKRHHGGYLGTKSRKQAGSWKQKTQKA